MSVIPSTRGSDGGLRILVYTANAVDAANTAVTSPLDTASYTQAIDVRGYDEVVLNIECLENFYTGIHPYVPGGSGTATYANEISVLMMYTTTNSFIPIAASSKFWSPFLVEEPTSGFPGTPGVVETAPYAVNLEGLQTDVMTKPNHGTLGRIVRFPVTMATWAFFKVIVDDLGSNPVVGHAISTLPVFNVNLTRSVTS
tara:strand:+ start:504 stop:1100 length:597 start_codon:yes stop_codon:yes gene_type:complete